jgi:hypothetical protein
MPALPQCLFECLQRGPQPRLPRLPSPHNSALRCLAPARRAAQGMVQRFLWDYAPIRRPESVPRRRVSLDCPWRPAMLAAGRRRLSRFPCRVRLGMRGVSDPTGSM